MFLSSFNVSLNFWVGVITIPRFLPLIGNGSRFFPFEHVRRNDLGDLFEYGFRHIVGMVRVTIEVPFFFFFKERVKGFLMVLFC